MLPDRQTIFGRPLYFEDETTEGEGKEEKKAKIRRNVGYKKRSQQ